MSSFRTEPVNKHVTGYPSAYPPADAQSTYQANTCIGYPQPAPPPPPPDRSPNCSLQSNRTCRWLILFFLFGLFLFAIIYFIVWLFVRPQLPEFRIHSATIPPWNRTAYRIISHDQWEVILQVKNPNKKMNIIYGDTEAGVFYGDDKLWETTIPAFSQQKDTEEDFLLELNQVNGTVASRIQEDVKRRTISLDVDMLVWISFKTSFFSTWVHLISISCADVRVRFDNSSGVGNWEGGDDMCLTDFVR